MKDFNPATEEFTTSSTPSYSAYVTFDADAIYLAYEGPDVAANIQSKWVLAYFDVDPGLGSGSSVGERYNTERPDFPADFLADLTWVWRTDNNFEALKNFDSGTSNWTAQSPAPMQTFQSGSYVETRIPRTALGNPSRVRIVTLMINEKAFEEAAYAGLYQGTFTDGYYAEVPISSYLELDLNSSTWPNDSANQHP